MKSEDNVGRHGWRVLIFLESRCIYTQSETSFDADPKDEHFTHMLYTCFVAVNINILLFQLHKYYLLPTICPPCFLFTSVFLSTVNWDDLSYLFVGLNPIPLENSDVLSINFKNIESDPPSMSLSSFQDDFSVLQQWINNSITLIIMENVNWH